MKIKSEFALLDVLEPEKSGLPKYLKVNGKIPVTIQGYLVKTWSNHDGKSMQYHVEVTNVVCEEANR